MPEETKPQQNPAEVSPQSAQPATTADPLAPTAVNNVGAAPGQNTSGMGGGYPAPAGVAGWGWGPFFLSWIWGIGNGVWIALLAFVPFIGYIMPFILGAKGREWAWQAKKWESVEAFNATQKKWAIWGLILMALPVTLILLMIIIVAINPASHTTPR